MKKIPYKPEIDGLRAVAVLSVILFHFEFTIFSGGYIGVDVFFVISGFLITQLIQKNIRSDSFRFSEFYIRRVRRLFPALFFTIALTFLASIFILSPAHLERLGGSALYSQLALSNYFLWSETGYFDIDSIYKPLLHMWSLSVEEQFYIFWPLCIYYLTTKCSHMKAFLFIIAISLLSLYLSHSQLMENASSAFYLVPYRVFEFGIGALVVFFIAYRPSRSWVEEIVFLLGLMLIGYSIVAFDTDTSFPGIKALIPTIGAALIIYAGSAGFVGKILTNSIAVRIGLISYSLYLAHWPIYVLYKYSRIGEITDFERFGLIILSFLVGYLMYRFIEDPLRHPKNTTKSSGTNFVLVSSLCALFLSLPLAHSWANNGWTWRMEPVIERQLGQSFVERMKRGATIRSHTCHMNKKDQDWEEFIVSSKICNTVEDDSTIVLGDSHAADLWAALEKNYPDRNFIQMTGAGCTFDVKKGHCPKLFKFARKMIYDNPGKIKRIIYTQRANKTMFKGDDPIKSKFVDIREELEDLSSKKINVYWYGPQIEFEPDIPTLLAGSLTMESFYALAKTKQVSRIFFADEAIERIMKNSSVNYISKLRILCPEGVCPLIDNNKNILYPDYGHWTADGGVYLTKKLVPMFPQ